MPPFNLHNNSSLLSTTVHGMSQELFLVTEDRVSNFNSYSQELQFCSALFFTALGLALGNLSDIKSTIFMVSAILSVLLLIALIWQYCKFTKAKDKLFKKADTPVSLDSATSELEA